MQMLPPPLPGDPRQAPPPPPQAAPLPPPVYAQPTPVAQPQGYPGPAVAVPGVPQQGTPFPAYAQQPQAAPPAAYPPPTQYQGAPTAPQQGYAPTAIDIGSAIADATGGDRDPQPPPGKYRFQILRTIVTQHPIERKLTLKASLKVITSDNPNCPEGAEVSYIEGLQWGAVRAQDFIVNAAGYPQKGLFDQAMASVGRDPKNELKLLSNAVGNPDAQQPGNHYPPNPLQGRIIDGTVSENTKIAGPKSAKAGQQVTYKNYNWSPA